MRQNIFNKATTVAYGLSLSSTDQTLVIYYSVKTKFALKHVVSVAQDISFVI